MRTVPASLILQIVLTIASVVTTGLLLAFPVFTDGASSRCLALFILVVSFWAIGLVPIYATSLLVPLLAVAFRVVKDSQGHEVLPGAEASHVIVGSMFGSVTLVLLGAFTIATALKKYHLSARLGLNRLLMQCSRVGVFLAVVMLVCLWASAVMPHEASFMLMFTAIGYLFEQYPADSVIAKGAVAALLVGSQFGGTMSPISSAHNALGAQFMPSSFNIGWLQWLMAMAPVAHISVFLSWLLIMFTYGLFNQTIRLAEQKSKDKEAEYPAWKPWLALALCIVSFIAWSLSPLLTPVLGNLGIISLIPFILLFGTGLLDQHDFFRIPWEVLLLSFGGMGLSAAMRRSGLLKILGHEVRSILRHGLLFPKAALLCLFLLFFATIKSHFVTALIFLPIIAALYEDATEAIEITEGRCIYMMAIMAVSFGMALPVSGLINMACVAIVDNKRERVFRFKDFLRIGLPASLIGLASIYAVGFPLLRYVW